MSGRSLCPRCCGWRPIVVGELCEDCASDLADERDIGDPQLEQVELDRAEDDYLNARIGES